jgi:hypothetical protein
MIQRYSIGDLLHKSHFGSEKYCKSEDVEKLEKQTKQRDEIIIKCREIFNDIYWTSGNIIGVEDLSEQGKLLIDKYTEWRGNYDV